MSKFFAPALIAGSVVFAPAFGFAAMPTAAALTEAHDGAIVQVAAKKKKMTRREEADKSVRDGTVPARYRRNVPKEYHQYIPFAKQ